MLALPPASFWVKIGCRSSPRRCHAGVSQETKMTVQDGSFEAVWRDKWLAAIDLKRFAVQRKPEQLIRQQLDAFLDRIRTQLHQRPADVTPVSTAPTPLEERQAEMRERMANQPPPRKPPGRSIREIKPNEYYTPEELTVLGPSADTFRRLFKDETEGVNRLPRPETLHKRGYESLWIKGSAAIAKLNNPATNSKKRPRKHRTATG